jgi:hypothetical protein
MPDVALKVIDEPETGARPVISSSIRGLLFIRGEEHAPSLTCGHCREILVRCVPPQRFVTTKMAREMKVRGIPFLSGPQPTSLTLTLPCGWYVVADTHLVLRCPSCQAFNDTDASITA